ERVSTAAFLAAIAEFDRRRLYAPAAHPSMFSYCVHQLGLSEDAAAKRIQAARAAQRFPTIFAALADGRLHLTSVNLLAPYLTEETAGELLVAASRKTKGEVLQLLAERFPRPEVLPWLTAVGAQHAPAHVGTLEEPPMDGAAELVRPEPVGSGPQHA